MDSNEKNITTPRLIEENDERFRIDPTSAPYIEGLTLDYKIEGLNESFVFVNPKETYRCGCGESIGF